MTCRNNNLFSILLFASGIFFLYPLAQVQSSPIIFIWNGTDYAKVYPFADQDRANTQPVQCFKFDPVSAKYVCQNGGQSITVPLKGYFCTTVTVESGPLNNYGYCLGQPTNTHDFNGDGKSDIAWRDNSGNVAIWLMNGAQPLQTAIIGNNSIASSMVGQRDFNGDGDSDILWYDTSGNVGMWLMNGIQQPEGAFVGNVQTTWSVVGTGDFNGDGKGDILWRNTNGDVAIWLMNGTQFLSPGVGLGNVDNTW
jgi:hypothetical protein